MIVIKKDEEKVFLIIQRCRAKKFLRSFLELIDPSEQRGHFRYNSG